MSARPSPNIWYIRPPGEFDSEKLRLKFWMHEVELANPVDLRVYIGEDLAFSGSMASDSGSFRRGTVQANGWCPFFVWLKHHDLAKQALKANGLIRVSAYVGETVAPVADIALDRAVLPLADQGYLDTLARAVPRYHWRVERVFKHKNTAHIYGWALPGDHALDIWINGKPAKVRTAVYSEFGERVYWFMRGAAWVGFIASVELDDLDKLEWLEVDRRSTLTTFSNKRLPSFKQYRFVGDPSNIQALAPPIAGLKRIMGAQATAISYFHLGMTDFHVLKDIAAAYGLEAADPKKAILDWGCGCGRITRHFAALKKGEGEVWGVDIDRDNVAWCTNNIAGAKFATIDLFPPVDLPSSHFDLIFAVSVLSHLTEEAMDKWLAEVARLLSPNGLALLTYNGMTTTSIHLSRQPAAYERAAQTGFFDGIRDGALDGHIRDEEYYRLTMMSDNYATAKFERFFDLVDVVPSSLAGFQNTAVLRTKSPAKPQSRGRTSSRKTEKSRLSRWMRA